MAISQSTFSNASGAVSDLFGGIGDIMQGDLKAKGLNIQAEGIRLKAQGDLAEATNYDRATVLAEQNKAFTENSTAIQTSQLERNNYLQIGRQRADIAGAGFAASGSSLDILRDSASQGALSKAVLGQQGLITEAGYEEQAASYKTLADTARTTAAGEENIANETDQLAKDTKSAANVAAAGDFISSAIKVGATIAPFLLV
jgi:hypothetical protein